MFEEKKALMEWAASIKYPFSHYIVAQTSYRPFNKSLSYIREVRHELSADMRHTFNKLGRVLNLDLKNYSHKRLLPYMPARLVSIESLSPYLTHRHTTHFNILIGNINQAINTDQLSNTFKEIWEATRYGTPDIKAQIFDGRDAVFNYMFKEDRNQYEFYDTGLTSLDTNSSYLPDNPAFVY